MIREGNRTLLRPSTGGLVTAISCYLKGSNQTFNSVLWAGASEVGNELWSDENTQEFDYVLLPVFCTEQQYSLYYEGFCNSVIWPLFHYFPSFVEYSADYYAAYLAINQLFFEKVSAEIRKGDTVWIHDYHLIPLAGKLRQEHPNLTIGFFLHTPFPTYELFRLIPKKWQTELLSGILGADLIGFHTQSYSKHFFECVQRILGYSQTGNSISVDSRAVKVLNLPIGIDYELFNQSFENTKAIQLRENNLNLKGDGKLLFSVDRLDYTKGVSHRLKGFATFLNDHPEYVGKVQFAIVIVPSRDSIQKYVERKKLIDELISNINSNIGTIHWQPILYQYNHLSFEELVAFYSACDVAVITPLRDGMNLVAKEFVASRKDKRGVLLLSEMAGTAEELKDALLINPNDEQEIADMIYRALSMPEAEQELRMERMQESLKRNTVLNWAESFFRELKETKESQIISQPPNLDTFSRFKLLNEYASSRKRLIMLDYDGTLVAFKKTPVEAFPDGQLLERLDSICSNHYNDVYITSGRDSSTLDNWFGNLNIGLISEHGAKIKHPNMTWRSRIWDHELPWQTPVKEIFDQFCKKVAGSLVEEKEFSIAWHYRNTKGSDGAKAAEKLVLELRTLNYSGMFQILTGNMVVEVKPVGINKGSALLEVMDQNDYQFVLAAGDDGTDETMFKTLVNHPHAFSIKVGNGSSLAKFHLFSHQMVRVLLQTMEMYGQPAETN